MTGYNSRTSKGTLRYAKDLADSLRPYVTLCADKPDIVHAISPVAFPRGKPFVVSVADIAPISRLNSESANYRTLKSKIYTRYVKLIVDRSFAHANAIVSISSQTTDEIRNFLPRYIHKVTWVMPGISPKFENKGGQRKGRVIGYYREMSPMMKETISILDQNKVEYSLLWLNGEMSEDDLVQYYNSIDYFIDLMPYRGFGYPLIEARACGASVMTRRDARIPEEVKACTIQVDSAQDAADKITQAIHQPPSDLPFKMDSMAKNTLKVYDSVLSTA